MAQADPADTIITPEHQIVRLSTADLNTTVNHEPRVEDVKLGFSLGMKNPASAMRKLIRRHRQALERFGEVVSTVEKTSAKGGRPGKSFWLSKRQALFICTKSETERATEATIQMVEVFDEHLKGTLGKPVRVRQHHRRLPAPEDTGAFRPGRFEPGSDMARDLLLLVRSVASRVRHAPGLSLVAALEQALEDIIALKENPAASTRGALFDWDVDRASEDHYRKLRAQGRDDIKRPIRARAVRPEQYGGSKH